MTKGAVSGLFLVTSLTIRAEMQIQSLSFSMSTQRRDAIDVSISMIHSPKPSMLNGILDVAELATGSAMALF